MKNVVLVITDSLRADHVGALGYSRNTTPHIDKLARECVLFTRAFTNGVPTVYSFKSFLTSTYPRMIGRGKRLPRWRKTLPEILKAHGYYTIGITSNPNTSRYYGYHRGFDVFEDFLPLSGSISEDKEGKKKAKRLFPKDNALAWFFHQVRRASKLILSKELPHENGESITKKSITKLEDKPEGSAFFLLAHYMDTHVPFIPPLTYLQKLALKSPNILKKLWLWKKGTEKMRFSDEEIATLIDLYDGCIRYTDEAIGSLVKGLRELGVYEDTLLIITSDHGEAFGEHGLVGHGLLHEESIHIPLVMGGDIPRGGMRIDRPVELLTLYPTLLDFLNLPLPPSIEGKSLFPVIFGEKAGKEGVISERTWGGGWITSYRTKEWKYIVDEATGKQELYNLNNDPKEMKNLYRSEKSKAKNLAQCVKVHIRRARRTADERKRIIEQVEGAKDLTKNGRR